MQFQDERLAAALLIPQQMDAVIESTIDYLRNRKAFAGTLLDKQHIQFTLAELKTEVEAVRSICYRGVEKMVEGEDATLLASMAKLKGGSYPYFPLK